jgi:hypothetical protein
MMKQPRKHYAYLPCQSFKGAVDMDQAFSYGLGPALLTEYPAVHRVMPTWETGPS